MKTATQATFLLDLIKENRMDFLKDECKRDSTSSYCSDLTKRLADHRTRYGIDYGPKAVSYPEINLTNYWIGQEVFVITVADLSLYRGNFST